MLYLLLAFAVAPPQGNLREGIELSLKGDYEASETILSLSRDHSPSYLFYRMVNAHSLNKRKEALKWAEMIEYGFGEMPTRYRDLALIIKYDVEEWVQKEDDLGDIAREMKKVADRLRNDKGGKVTRKIQDEVQNRLAKMIDKMEKDLENASKSPSTADTTDKIPIPPPDTVSPELPPATGKVDPKKVKEIAEVWGKLPEKERASALKELTRVLPPYEKRLIEEYFRQLAKRNSK